MLIGIIIAVVVLALLWILGYNSLVKHRNWAEEAWAQIDVQLKRRHDMIPNLVEIVKGYAKHEQETFEKIVDARNRMFNPGNNRNDEMAAHDQLSQSLKSLFALREDYPELKANENFLRLQEDLTGIENKIAYSRQSYNSSVMHYNTKIQTIPSNIIASVHGFQRMELLEAREEERENVKISF